MRNDRKTFVGVRKQSCSVRKHSRGKLTPKIRKKKHIREQSQAILIEGKTCVVIAGRL